MHFHLTAIDREGKEWEIITLYFRHWGVMVIVKNMEGYMAILKDTLLDDDRCVIKEWSSPSELRAWRKKWMRTKKL